MEKVQHRSNWRKYTIDQLSLLRKYLSCHTKIRRLKTLHLPSLCIRHLQGNLIETLKILKGFSNINVDIFFERSTDSRTRGHSFKLFKKQFRTNIHKNFSLTI